MAIEAVRQQTTETLQKLYDGKLRLEVATAARSSTPGLRTDADGQSRSAKSVRQTGISLRLDLAPHPDCRDIAK